MIRLKREFSNRLVLKTVISKLFALNFNSLMLVNNFLHFMLFFLPSSKESPKMLYLRLKFL